MTLEQARARIGDGVAYRPVRIGFEPVTDEQRRNDYCNRAPAEEGVITSVGERYVFVRYGDDLHSKATDPAALTLLAGEGPDRGAAEAGQ